MITNKKGFTLIEILATITIFGILMGIAIVSVTNVIENGKKKHYTTAEANMVLAGQSFVQQNRAQLPKAIGQKKKIPMSMLVDKNYIEPIKDYSDNECNMEESYIQVFKYSQNDYSYVSYLECPNYNSQENINDMTPEIDAVINVDEAKSKVTSSVTITGNDKLMSYAYIIYRGSKEVKNTGSTAVTGNKESLSFELSLTDYTPGNIKMVITATNTYGNTKTVTVTKDVKDTKKPTCVYLNTEDQNDKAWTGENRKVTVGCDDGDGSGCTRETFTKTFKSTVDYDYITIEDESGNKEKCKVSVFVDKTKPSCTDSGDSTTWTSGNRTINWGCSDGQSGCHVSYSGGSTPFTTTTKTSTIASYTIKDNVGNTRTCAARTANVYVDKTAPSCTNSGDSTSWTKNDRTIKWGCSDSESGCNSSYDGGSTPFTTTTKTATIASYTIKDKVGNSATCAARTANVYVDKTAPSCTNSGDSTSWTASNRTINWGCSDSHSGCNTDYDGGSTPFTTTTKTASIAAYTIKDKVGNSTTCAARTANVYVDKTAPTISSITNPTGGVATDTAFALTLNGTDAHSGIAKWRYKYAASASWTDYANSNKTSFTTTKFSAVRNENVYISVCDSAGNCSNASTSPIYIVADLCASTTTKWSGTWGACSKSCGKGTQTMTGTKYSTLNPSHSCGSASTTQYCNDIDCCSWTWTDWGDWGSCDASCGTGTKYRSGTKYSNYDGSNCGSDSDSESCDAGSCEPPPHNHQWNCRDAASPYGLGFSWDCTAGHTGHTTGFRITCCICGTTKNFSAKLWCPYNTSPAVFSG